ncbi:hypothetical protein ARD30_05190 [Bosea thiooxidans]|uniref:Peptidase propeptide and YPEB domain-containing protein n=1 Tax=Bosea thiooxidans TaxID=53254 RepID=A0A0Q3SWT5_9HYPH|nr:hypothetical protein [Bosea thiooxidans]KQK29746.1 hypothetical protein ARD30_05190 [Bosea thiooxidans]SKB33781.1 hypothetical protein SAMN05660750_00167 [Bosea thiooxidans]
MRRNGAIIGLLIALALSGGIARAAHGQNDLVSEQRARDIAWRAGLVHVEQITRSGDRWEVAGRTVDDEVIIIDIDIRNGRILD